MAKSAIGKNVFSFDEDRRSEDKILKYSDSDDISPYIADKYILGHCSVPHFCFIDQEIYDRFSTGRHAHCVEYFVKIRFGAQKWKKQPKTAEKRRFYRFVDVFRIFLPIGSYDFF